MVSFRGKERKPNHAHQLFSQAYYDAEGNKYEINAWTSGMAGDAIEEGYFGEEFPLKNYLKDEVWLTPSYSHVWTAEDPISIVVQ